MCNGVQTSDEKTRQVPRNGFLFNLTATRFSKFTTSLFISAKVNIVCVPVV